MNRARKRGRDGRRAADIGGAAAHGDDVLSPMELCTGRGPVTLSPNQVEACKKLVAIVEKSRWGVNLSETGVGKTYMTAHIAQALDLPAFVVCPPAARTAWTRVAQAHTFPMIDLITYHYIAGQRHCPVGHRWLVRADTVRHVETQASSLGLASPGEQVVTKFHVTNDFMRAAEAGILLVVDEAHLVKNDTSARHKAVRSLVTHIVQSDGPSRVMLLSATLMDKEVHAANLFSLLGVVTRTLFRATRGGRTRAGLDQFTRYLVKWMFARGRSQSLVSRAVAALRGDIESIVNARHVLFMAFLNHMRDDVAVAAPRAATDAIKDVRNLFYPLAGKEAAMYTQGVSLLSAGVRYDPDANGGRGGVGAGNEQRFGLIQRGMVKMQKAKAASAVRLARCILRTVPHSKVVLFADFHDVLSYYRDELASFRPLRVDGGVPAKYRPAIVDRFQRPDDEFRVLVANAACGSMSLNLHDTTGRFPRTMVIMPSYFASNLQQASGRVFRHGVIGKARVRFLYGQTEGLSRVTENNVLDCMIRKGGVMQQVHAAQVGTVFPNEFAHEDLDDFFVHPDPQQGDDVSRGIMAFLRSRMPVGQHEDEGEADGVLDDDGGGIAADVGGVPGVPGFDPAEYGLDDGALDDGGRTPKRRRVGSHDRHVSCASGAGAGAGAGAGSDSDDIGSGVFNYVSDSDDSSAIPDVDVLMSPRLPQPLDCIAKAPPRVPPRGKRVGCGDSSDGDDDDASVATASAAVSHADSVVNAAAAPSPLQRTRGDRSGRSGGGPRNGTDKACAASAAGDGSGSGNDAGSGTGSGSGSGSGDVVNSGSCGRGGGVGGRKHGGVRGDHSNGGAVASDGCGNSVRDDSQNGAGADDVIPVLDESQHGATVDDVISVLDVSRNGAGAEADGVISLLDESLTDDEGSVILLLD